MKVARRVVRVSWALVGSSWGTRGRQSRRFSYDPLGGELRD